MFDHTNAIGLHPNKAAKLWRAEVRDAKTLSELSEEIAKEKGLDADDWELVANFGDAMVRPCTSRASTSSSLVGVEAWVKSSPPSWLQPAHL